MSTSATAPSIRVLIEDETIVHEPADGMIVSAVTFKSGKRRMQMNAFHYMIAAISAYISRLDHDLVLALASSGFDSPKDDLTSMIGSRWGAVRPRGGGHAPRASCPATGGARTARSDDVRIFGMRAACRRASV
jgi:hypothetical protein